MKNKTFTKALKHASDGVIVAFKEERNLKIHAFLATMSIIVGMFFSLNTVEWLWLIHCIALVFLMEMFNTIIENIVDVLTNKHYYDWAKKVKDMAAGAVLLSAIYASTVACILFIPKIVDFF